MNQRDEMVAYARTLIGRKYRPGLNLKCDDLDCFGVIVEVAQAFGLYVPDQATEGLPISYHQSHEIATRSFHFVDKPLPGDFIMVNVGKNVNATGRVHFALITPGDLWPPMGMICTNAIVGQVVEGKFDKRFLNHQHEFCRFRGVE